MTMFNEGELAQLDALCRGNLPTQFYLRLYNVADPAAVAEGDTLTNLSATEVAGGTGYAPMLVERNETGWPTLQTNAEGKGEARTKAITLTAAGGAIGPFNLMVLATTSDNTGKAVARSGFADKGDGQGTSRTIADGNSIELTYVLTQE